MSAPTGRCIRDYFCQGGNHSTTCPQHPSRKREAESDWVGPSIVLIENDDSVVISARTLTSLISFALANPSNDVSTRIRDEAVDDAHREIVAAYRSVYGDLP